MPSDPRRPERIERGSPRAGLRERKKAQTRLAIQTQALRLFRQQGYQATTVEQIIDAADVSESTFFRYFPTKADLVLRDDLDPLFYAAILDQPGHLSAVQAIRSAFRSVMTGDPDEQQEQRERMDLALAVPELRAAVLDSLAAGIDLLAGAVARRTGRQAEDPAVRALAGAVLGVAISVMLAVAGDPDADLAARLDEALAQLEAGFAL